MKDFKIFDYVSFPTDKGSEEIREGFIYQIHSTQIDLVSIRKKDGNKFGDFGFHKKYLEKGCEFKYARACESITHHFWNDKDYSNYAKYG